MANAEFTYHEYYRAAVSGTSLETVDRTKATRWVQDREEAIKSSTPMILALPVATPINVQSRVMLSDYAIKLNNDLEESKAAAKEGIPF